MVARNETAFKAYTVATLVVARATPGRAGPRTEADWYRIEFREIALGRSWSGTRLGSSDCRAGPSAEPAAAPIPATTRMTQGFAWPVTVTSARVVATLIITSWAPSMRLRRSTASATTPLQGAYSRFWTVSARAPRP